MSTISNWVQQQHLGNNQSVYYQPDDSQIKSEQKNLHRSADYSEFGGKAAPFIFKYFITVEPGIARCSICFNQKGQRVEYSVRHSCFKNAQRHLARHHKIINKKTVQKKEKIQKIMIRLQKTSKAVSSNPLSSLAENPEGKKKFISSKSRYAPYIFQYFTKVDEDYVRCNICELSGRTTLYNIKKSVFKNAQFHLEREHAINPQEKDLKELPSDVKSYAYEQTERPQQPQTQMGRRSRMRQIVFQYFTKISQTFANCNLCERKGKTVTLSVKNSVYRNVVRHLENEHYIKVDKSSDRDTKYNKSRSIKNAEKQIIDLICKHGVSLYTLDCNKFLKNAFRALGIQSTDSAAIILLKQFKMQKEKIRSSLALKKTAGKKFSLSLSQVTIAQRQWLIVSLHNQQGGFTCLGVIKLSQKMSLNELQNWICNKLYDYGIHFADILCIVCSGDSTQQIEKCSFKKPRLFCLANDMQMALQRALYSPENIISPQSSYSQQKFQQQYIDELMLQFPSQDEDEFLDPEVSRVIIKIRKIVFTQYGLIKQASINVKNDHYFSPQRLRLDTKFRWRSLFAMLKHYLDRQGKYLANAPKLDSNLLLANRQKVKLSQFFKILKAVESYLDYVIQPKVNILIVIERLQMLVQEVSRYKTPLSKKIIQYGLKLIQKLNSSQFVILLSYLSNHQLKMTQLDQQKITNLLKIILSDQKYHNNNIISDGQMQQYKGSQDKSQEKIIQTCQRKQNVSHLEEQQTTNQIQRFNFDKILIEYEKQGVKDETLKIAEKRLSCIPVSLNDIYKKFLEVSRIINLQPGKLTKQAVECLIVLGYNMRNNVQQHQQAKS